MQKFCELLSVTTEEQSFDNKYWQTYDRTHFCYAETNGPTTTLAAEAPAVGANANSLSSCAHEATMDNYESPLQGRGYRLSSGSPMPRLGDQRVHSNVEECAQLCLGKGGERRPFMFSSAKQDRCELLSSTSGERHYSNANWQQYDRSLCTP